MSNHHPAPWSYNRGTEIRQANGLVIANVNHNFQDETVIANANLIAAAPEMLEALNKIKSDYIEGLSRTQWHENYSDVQAVIDKATGGAK